MNRTSHHVYIEKLLTSVGWTRSVITTRFASRREHSERPSGNPSARAGRRSRVTCDWLVRRAGLNRLAGRESGSFELQLRRTRRIDSEYFTDRGCSEWLLTIIKPASTLPPQSCFYYRKPEPWRDFMGY
ncbi:hypothetical protein MHYP_G00064370 [Metynnis hypsauchen]